MFLSDNIDILYKYYFTSSGQCHKSAVFSSNNIDTPFVLENNFIYQEELLQSHETSRYPFEYEYSSDKVIYKYDDKKRKIQKIKYSDKDITRCTYVYNNKGQLTDYIQEHSNKHDTYTDVTCWNASEINRVQYRYDDFNKKGDWTKSYFIIEAEKKFRSKRKIEYW